MLKVIFVNVQAKIRFMMFSIDFQSLIITKISLFMLHWWLVLWVIHRVIVHCILVVNLMLYHYGVLHIKNFFLSVLNWKVNELIKWNVTSKKIGENFDKAISPSTENVVGEIWNNHAFIFSPIWFWKFSSNGAETSLIPNLL